MHVQYYRNSLGFKHCNAMHAYKPESQWVPQEYRQLSLRIESPLSFHDPQKLASGLSGGIDATAHALRVIDVHTVYSVQPIYTLSHAIASSGKVKNLSAFSISEIAIYLYTHVARS